MKTKRSRILAICALVALALFFVVPLIRQRMLSVLCRAAIDGDMTLVQVCLMAGPDLNKHPDQDGLPGLLAIDCAAIGGHEGIVALLLQHGANPNPPAPSPLIIACSLGHYDVAKVLLEHGADPNANGNNSGDGTPLNAATGYPEIVKLLRSHGAKE
ncbi:MAG: ankyrin repeat domain-containing protein [Verrucomicrobiaceae bacterium]